MTLDELIALLIEVALKIWGAARVRAHVDAWEDARVAADDAERIKFGASSREPHG